MPCDLVSSALSDCATPPAPAAPVSAYFAPPLHVFHLDHYFLWATPAARFAMVAWARDTYIVQVATASDPFVGLPTDCVGDILDFFEMAMTHTEALHIATQCASPEARSWVHLVVSAAASIAIAVYIIIRIH